MFLVAGPHEFPCPLEKVGLQVLHGAGRHRSLLGKDAELTVEQTGQLMRALCIRRANLQTWFGLKWMAHPVFCAFNT